MLNKLKDYFFISSLNHRSKNKIPFLFHFIHKNLWTIHTWLIHPETYYTPLIYYVEKVRTTLRQKCYKENQSIRPSQGERGGEDETIYPSTLNFVRAWALPITNITPKRSFSSCLLFLYQSELL